MNNKEVLSKLLNTNGFKLTESDKSKYFSDYYDLFSDGVIVLRVSSTKSFETIDVSSIKECKCWYDLALVKALIYQEKELNNITSIEDHIKFLENNINFIRELFLNENYLNTINKLKELEILRMKQMFPGKTK